MASVNSPMLSFRDGPKDQTRNLEIPGSCFARPGMTNKNDKCSRGDFAMKLHGYFRSSASYRVRIALNLKGLSAEHLSHHLRKGEQRAPDYLTINPQGLVPTLQGDGAILTQSLAIIE